MELGLVPGEDAHRPEQEVLSIYLCYMASREKLFKKLRLIKPVLLEKYPISRLAIFGSYGRGDYSDQSDLDIMVELQGGIGMGFIALAMELEAALGVKVDLVSKNGLKPQYLPAIEQDLTYV